MDKRQPKSIIALCLFTALLLALAGCSAGEGAIGNHASTATAQQTTTGQNPDGPFNLSSKKIGFNVGNTLASLSNQQMDQEMADIASLGVKWLRFDVAWDMIQPTNSTHYDWSATERIVLAARRHNLNLIGVLAYPPEWARQAACKNNFACAPADDAAFANFAREAVRRYTPMGLHTWEVWNEPNNNSFWLPQPNAAVYVQLLKVTYTAIKQVNPGATVLNGGLSPAENIPGHIAPRDFLRGMYQNGAKDYFDELSYHPFSFPLLPDDVMSWSCWSQMSDLNPSIRSIMSEYGDGNKQIWATEFGMPSGGGAGLTETFEALSYKEALRQASEKPWLGALFFHTYIDLPGDRNQETNDFGIVRTDGSRKPAYQVLKEFLAQSKAAFPVAAPDEQSGSR